MLVRACLGEPQYTKEAMASARKPNERPDGRGAYNSIVARTMQEGGCVEHPEYIVFDKAQALPEYAIWYKHRSECWCTHCVNKSLGVTLVCGAQSETVSITGLTTAKAIKQKASQLFNVPIDDMDKVVNVFGAPFAKRSNFATDTTTCSDKDIRSCETIEITLKPTTATRQTRASASSAS